MEQSIIDGFRDCINRNNGEKISCTSLGAQDTIYADYLMSSSVNFCIIEFKYLEKNFKDETRKPLRHTLCEMLKFDNSLKSLHKQCHFVGWMADFSIQLDVYSNRICTQEVFKEDSCHVCKIESIFDHKDDSNTIAKELLNPGGTIGLSVSDFTHYLNKLSEIAGGGAENIELLVADTSKQTVCYKVFDSIEKLAEWHKEKLLEIFPSNKPKGPSSNSGPKPPGMG